MLDALTGSELPTVLIVDDERLNRSMLAELLSPHYRVLLAKDGPGALVIAHREAHRLQLILLDLAMPGMNGYEVLGALRAQERTAHIAVIFITGQSNAEAEEYGLRLGAADYVSKPIRPAVVEVRVRNQIRLALQRQALERLAMVDGLVAQSGGKLVLHSTPGNGTTVEMWMPISKDESTACHLGARRTQDVGPMDVLLVDDDPLVLANASALLEDLGHRVTALGAGQEAIDLLARKARFDVVISDYAMPGMNGVELAEHIAQRYPGLNFILASGFADTPALPPGMTRLAKPYSQEDLSQLLHQLMRA